jgi:hypothetical protein
MSIKATENEIRYEKPEDWLKWKPAFERIAKPSRIWRFIDPDGTDEFPTRAPRKTELSSFRRVVTLDDISQRQTRSQTAGLEEPELAVGKRHPTEKAETFMELHPDDRALLEQAQKAESVFQRDYSEILRDQQIIAAYMNKTISEEIQAMCMNDYPSVRDQYENLANYGGRAVENNEEDRRDDYWAAVAPLRNYPKDLPAWVAKWRYAVARAQAADVAEATNPKAWLADLIKALRPVAEALTGHLQLKLRKKAKAKTLTLHETSDTILSWHESQNERPRPKKLPVRGAFHVDHISDNDSASEAEGAFPALEAKQHDRGSRAQRGRGGRGGRGANHQARGSGGNRSGSQAGKRRPRDNDDEGEEGRDRRRPRSEKKEEGREKSGPSKTCLFCSQFHQTFCYYLFPDEAPEGWKANTNLSKNIAALIKGSQEHKAEYEKLKKRR